LEIILSKIVEVGLRFVRNMGKIKGY